MKKINLQELDNLINEKKTFVIIFGDSFSILTKTLYNMLQDINTEVSVLDTEQNLESYIKYRLRFTPTVHVYVSGNLEQVFTLPIQKEQIVKCLTK